MTHARFGSSDGWLLLSIIYAAGGAGASLRNIVSCGDYINHAIFTYAEVAEGINRLIAAGAVAVEKGAFVPTKRVLGPYGKYSTKNRAVFKELDFVEDLLQGFPPSAARRFPKVEITNAEFESAVKQYLSDFWETGNKSKKSRPLAAARAGRRKPELKEEEP